MTNSSVEPALAYYDGFVTEALMRINDHREHRLQNVRYRRAKLTIFGTSPPKSVTYEIYLDRAIHGRGAGAHMSNDQKAVIIGAISGIGVMIVLLWALYQALPEPSGSDEMASRIGYALRWNAIAALPLFAMLAAVGNARFLSEAIDPTLGKEDRKLLINGRVTDNTLQQFALFWAGSLAMAAALPGGQVRLVGAAAIVFVVMRLAFWIGYRVRPVYRAFGFSSTAYMNLFLLLGSIWLSFR
ncbi:MAPEG family protein [Sphingomonas tabacisoli]|uniref:MAPEG family protein n=1 Tax=Sphingomonas tabacisoli TaxID=2249466 RepID=A0ABW4I601_9SPHN